MLFQIYGDTSLWQLLGWALVFTGLVWEVILSALK